MIHHFDGSRWLPGSAHREGARVLPTHAQKGDCFNDVTGALGQSPEAVAESMGDLLMKQGALADLLPVAMDWNGLAQRIFDTWRATEGKVPLVRVMGQVVLAADESMAIQVQSPWPKDLVQRAAPLALALVRANGQMDYMRRQPWFATGRYEVVLQLESQVQVEQRVSQLIWHKDTDGTVLFSNLMFCNEPGLPATEWTPDLQPMSAEKRALVAKQWPAELLTQIDQTREALRQRDPLTWVIEGGRLAANGYVSWVDELVWHASPMLKHRDRWCLDDAMAVVARPMFTEMTYDLLLQMVQTPEGALAHWMRSHDIAPEDFSYEKAASLWSTLVHGSPPDDALNAAIQTDLRAIDWMQRTVYTGIGISTSEVEPTGDAHQPLAQPAGILNRPRRNSEVMSALRKDPASQKGRHFMQVLVLVRPRR